MFDKCSGFLSLFRSPEGGGGPVSTRMRVTLTQKKKGAVIAGSDQTANVDLRVYFRLKLP